MSTIDATTNLGLRALAATMYPERPPIRRILDTHAGRRQPPAQRHAEPGIDAQMHLNDRHRVGADAEEQARTTEDGPGLAALPVGLGEDRDPVAGRLEHAPDHPLVLEKLDRLLR